MTPDWKRLRSGAPWMTNAALCVLGFGLLLLSKQFVGEQSQFRFGFDGVSAWSAWVYVAASLVVLTQPTNRATLWIVVGFAVAFRMCTVFVDPYLSTDVYRYVWDGIVQHAHVNPYRYVPGDKALTFLRAPHQEIYDNINRRDYAVTIYPPAAQMVFWIATWFSPTVTAMKVVLVGFECVTAGAVVALLRAMGRPRAQVLLYAWCPLLVWEVGGSGHVDPAVFAFIALALLMRYQRRPALTGLFLGLAVMTKFYPLVLLPALWMRDGEAKGLRRLGAWEMPAVMAAVAGGGYALYASVGIKVFGFLGGYAKEEGLQNGSRFFLLDLVQSWSGFAWVTEKMFLVVCALVLGGISWWSWRWAAVEGVGGKKERGQPKFLWAAMWMGLAMMLLFSPHYPWYILWLIPFFALTPNLPLLVYLMAFFYGFTTQWADPGPKMFLLNKWLYGAVGLALLAYGLLRRWGLREILCVDSPTGPVNAEDAAMRGGSSA